MTFALVLVLVVSLVWIFAFSRQRELSTQAPEPLELRAYITGYTYYDNTPPGTALISNPVVHQAAGGVGTYADPVTVAVGHSYATGEDVLDFPAGTRFYHPKLAKYFIVEDTCGDGDKPEAGPCHQHPSDVDAWLDLWIDGEGAGKEGANACAARITGNFVIIQNPIDSYKVEVAPICPAKDDSTS